jgi:hypothetical protein
MTADTSTTQAGMPPGNPLPSEPALVDLNEIIQKALAPLQRSNRVIRCGELPLVKGSKEQWQQLMEALLYCIFSGSEPRKKLYLHIDVEKVQEQCAGDSEAVRYAQIQFYTNLAVSADWLNHCTSAFEKCRRICESVGAQLIMNSDGQSGNLFLIKIPVLS